MAYSNLDYLRRFYLQRYYFQRCRQSVGKPNRMYSSPKLVTAWLLPSLDQKGVRGRKSKGVSRRKGYCLVRRSSNLCWEDVFREQ